MKLAPYFSVAARVDAHYTRTLPDLFWLAGCVRRELDETLDDIWVASSKPASKRRASRMGMCTPGMCHPVCVHPPAMRHSYNQWSPCEANGCVW